MNCTKWKSNEEIMDTFMDILDLSVVDNKRIITKDYERFVKVQNISIEKYLEIKEEVLKKISSKLKINKIEFEYFFKVLNIIKLQNPTLNASQMQLDFILLFEFIIPFLVSKLDYKTLKIIQEYINEIPFKKFYEKYSQLGEKLKEKKDYNLVSQNVKNWKEGKIISLNSKTEILEIIKQKGEFEIVVILQNALYKLKNYFNDEKIFNIILDHIGILIEIDFAIENAEDSYQALLTKSYLQHSNILKEYFYKFIIRNDYIFEPLNFGLPQFNDFINEITKNFKYLVLFDEKLYFNLLEIFTLVKYIKINFEIPISTLETQINNSLKNLRIDNDFYLRNEILSLKEEEFLDEFLKLYQRVEDKLHPFFQYFYAEYLFQKGELKNSLEYYKKALLGVNCIGPYAIDVIKKGLMISAELNNKKLKLNLKNNKSDFVKFYFEAIRIDIESYKYPSHALNDYKLEFQRYFGKLKTIKTGDINNYIAFKDEQDKIQLDVKKPNKKIKVPYKNYKIPQVLHFAGEGTFEEIKRLVKAGADVNYLSEIDNYNALIAALGNPLNEEKRKIALYLIEKMDIGIIEKTLPKKKENAFSYAIRWGEEEIVQTILDKGIDISWEKRVGEGNSTYLNYAIAIILGIKLRFGDKISHNNLEKAKKIFDLIYENTDNETLRKHKKDNVFMEQLKTLHLEKWETLNEIS